MASKVDMNDRILIVTSLFAHRGHHARWPENSAAAVADARDIGADGVEIDVWLTGDKDLIVNHDRTMGGALFVARPGLNSRTWRRSRPSATSSTRLAKCGSTLKLNQLVRIRTILRWRGRWRGTSTPRALPRSAWFQVSRSQFVKKCDDSRPRGKSVGSSRDNRVKPCWTR